MLIFRYDKTFEGLLTALFDAYSLKKFPDILLAEMNPLLYFMMRSLQLSQMKREVTEYGKGFRKNYPLQPLPV